MLSAKHSLPPEERQAISRLRQMLNEPGFLHASLILHRRRCGKPYCRCSRSKRHYHQSWLIGQTLKGRTRMQHLRPELLERVQVWIERYKEADALLEQISRTYWQRLKTRGRGRTPGRSPGVR